MPVYFKSYQRLIIFFFITALVGPFITSVGLAKFRYKLFYIYNIINITICTLSFWGLATGIYRGITINYLHGSQRADFTGLYIHSMTLAPMSAIAIFSCIYYLYKKKYTRKIKVILVFCLASSFLSMITAGSRGAIIAFVFGLLFFLFNIYRKKILKFIKILIFAILVVVLSFPLWENRVKFLVSKIENSNNNGSQLSTRAYKWEKRINEFKSSPFFGIGFASVDITKGAIYNKETGVIEPGTSWLAILSMTGICGFLCLVLVFINYIIFIIKQNDNRYYFSYLGSLLVFFMLHMISEGYALASGSLMFFYLWLLLGVVQIYKIEWK